MKTENPLKHFNVKFGDRSFHDRVRRCAKFDGKSVKRLCFDAIEDYVRCAETDDMLFANGKVIGSKLDLPRNGVSMN